MKKKLTKSNNKMFAGVCSGIAEYFGWDTTLTRVIYLALTVCTAFSGAILYLVLILVMPDPPKESSDYTTDSEGSGYNRG